MPESSDSDCNAVSTSRGPSTPKKRRRARGSDLSTTERLKQHKQLFRPEWMKNEEYNMWLKPTDDSSKARCSLCKKDFLAELTVIKNHALGKKHAQFVKDAQPRSVNIMRKFASGTLSTEDQAVRRAEIRMASFLAAHNVSFKAMDHLSLLMKECCMDSEIAKKIHIKRTKAKCVVKNVIGETQKQYLAQILQTVKFSILIDESTDIGCVKCACVVVRFYNNEAGAITSQFWELIQIFSTNDAAGSDAGATAERLFTMTMATFQKYDIPIINIIGFASDNCNTMMGVNNSVASRFRQLCPNIVIIGCICHSLHLCAAAACKELPRGAEDLARNVYAFFHSSAKRQAEFAQFQKFLDLDIHKMLHPSQTRWLSLMAVIQRMLEQWDALRLYFDEQWISHRLRNSETIHVLLNDRAIKGYFIFLEWVLPKITTMNTFFQSDQTIITKVHERMQLAYKELLLSYCRTDYVNKSNIADINPDLPTDSLNLVPLNSMYMGVSMERYLARPDIAANPDLVRDLRVNCRKFLIKVCCEIKQRFDFDDPVFSQIIALDPANALSCEYRIKVPSLVTLILNMPRCASEESLQVQDIDDQWRRLANSKQSLPLHMVDAKCKPDVFWHQLLQHEDECEYLNFKELAKFALSAISLPHSNAECERIFSKINAVKTKSRNRLITATVSGIVLADQAVKGDRNEKTCCYNFTLKPGMMNRMTSVGIYGPEKTAGSQASTSAIVTDCSSEDEISFA